MHGKPLVRIIRLCREIDETAGVIYARLSRKCSDRELSGFWQQMSDQEAEHVSFWRRAEQFEGIDDIPIPFAQPAKVILDLNKALTRSRDLLDRCDEDVGISKAFILAYRMEFYLLHPAFKMLFHLLGPSAGGTNPEDEYDSHIDGFITMLSERGNVTPELELLGETLQSLWRENKELALQATQDSLTEVFNRRGFFTFSVQFAYLAHRTGSTLAAMMIDLDHFKSINDHYGHAAGDRVIRGTARIISEQLRTSDIVGRYGGEEFIVLLPQVSSGATAKVAEKIRSSIEQRPPEGVPLSVSIGFAEARLSDRVREDYQELIRKADAALYQAKERGRNTIVEYLPQGDPAP